MRYMGGKFHIAGPIARLIQDQRGGGAVPYLEPFVGAANVLARVHGGRRIASDSNQALVTMLKAVQSGWLPPAELTRDQWNGLKERMDEHDPLTAFAGLCCSFGGHWWHGYIDSDPRTGQRYAENGHNSLKALAPRLAGVDLLACDYREHAPEGAVVYCDPPYAGTTGYRDAFDTAAFWATMRTWVERGNVILVSEYAAPADWAPVWTRRKVQGLRMRTEGGLEQPRTVERLFMHVSQAADIVPYYPPEQAELGV